MTGSAAPRVLLSRRALAHNARMLLRGGETVDLRHDAYGHGLDEVAQTVTAAGAGLVLTDTSEDAARLVARGVKARPGGSSAVDPGALFGIPDAEGIPAGLPVMTLQGRVLSTKPLLAGEAVSYGYTHRAERDTRVALVTGGYAQGILRALGNRARVQIGAGTHPIVGRIAMDVCVVDLEGGDAPVGAPVTFFGGTGGVRGGLGAWSALTGLTALEMAVVVGQHADRRWTE